MTAIEEAQQRHRINIGIARLAGQLGIHNNFNNAEDAHAFELLCDEAGFNCYIDELYIDGTVLHQPYAFVIKPLVV